MEGSHQINRRTAARVATDIALTCRVPATPVPARIVDLSETGCRLRVAAPLPENGVTVAIDAAGGAITGEVVWHAYGEIGVRFHRRLSKALAVHWGIAAPDAVVELAVVDEPARGAGRLLTHWFRRLGRFFS